MAGQQPAASLLCSNLRARSAALVSLTIFAAILAIFPTAQAQTFSVLHSFTNGSDGAFPVAGLTISGAQTFYGTTFGGGQADEGVAYRLTRAGTGWIVTPLIAFPGGYYGSSPYARVIVGPNRTLFGTTIDGGYYNHGTVYNLSPPVTVCTAAFCEWNNTVIYRFLGGSGANPYYGDLTFDQQGDIYGTTVEGGIANGGTVYELTPVNGGWAKSVLYLFESESAGTQPYGGVIFDHSGNLYGTTSQGGTHDWGAVYQLAPSGSGWTENVIYSFQGSTDGGTPECDLIFDQSGNLYGTTLGNGGDVPGSVFELSPSQGGWTFTLLHDFSGPGLSGPVAGLTMDAAGNLYGAALGGAYGYGEIFELSPTQNDGWTYTDLYDFFGAEDGAYPYGKVVADTSGNIFGTAETGGTYNGGTIWEIAP